MECPKCESIMKEAKGKIVDGEKIYYCVVCKYRTSQ